MIDLNHLTPEARQALVFPQPGGFGVLNYEIILTVDKENLEFKFVASANPDIMEVVQITAESNYYTMQREISTLMSTPMPPPARPALAQHPQITGNGVGSSTPSQRGGRKRPAGDTLAGSQSKQQKSARGDRARKSLLDPLRHSHPDNELRTLGRKPR